MPFLCGIALRRLADRGSSIVDEDVEPAETLGCLLDHCATGARVGDVKRNEGSSATKYLYCRLGLLGVARRHDNTGPGGSETMRHPEPDPAIAAGDDSDTPVEVE